MAGFDIMQLLGGQGGKGFDINQAMSDPRVALGLGLLSTQTPQQGIQQGIGLLSQQSELKRQQRKEQVDEEYRRMMMELKQRDAEQGKLPTGYRYGADGTAELIPGVDESYGKRSDPFAMPMPVYNPQTGRLEYATKGAVSSGGLQPPDAMPEPPKPPKPMPGSIVKLQNEALDAIGTASSIEADMDQFIKQIDETKLELGPLTNLSNRAKNWAGASDENSRNFSTFKSSLEKLRNDSLRLNKGVQTEGDAQRAWNELISDINDEKLVKERLDEIKRINKRGAALQQMNIDMMRQNYGYDPLDVSGYTNQKPAVGGEQPMVTPGEETKTIGNKLYIKQNGKWYEQ